MIWLFLLTPVDTICDKATMTPTRPRKPVKPLQKKKTVKVKRSVREHTKRIILLAGGVARVAAALAISPQAVSQWERIPQRHVAFVAKLSGRPPSQIRPDIFSKDYD